MPVMAPKLSSIPVDVVNPGTSWILYARVIGINNTPVTQSSINTITYTIHLPESDTSVTTGSIDKTTTVFDTLKTKVDDSRWEGDGVGFNFRWSVSPALSPTAGLTYRYRIKFLFTDGSQCFVVRDREAIAWGGPSI